MSSKSGKYSYNKILLSIIVILLLSPSVSAIEIRCDSLYSTNFCITSRDSWPVMFFSLGREKCNVTDGDNILIHDLINDIYTSDYYTVPYSGALRVIFSELYGKTEILTHDFFDSIEWLTSNFNNEMTRYVDKSHFQIGDSMVYVDSRQSPIKGVYTFFNKNSSALTPRLEVSNGIDITDFENIDSIAIPLTLFQENCNIGTFDSSVILAKKMIFNKFIISNSFETDTIYAYSNNLIDYMGFENISDFRQIVLQYLYPTESLSMGLNYIYRETSGDTMPIERTTFNLVEQKAFKGEIPFHCNYSSFSECNVQHQYCCIYGLFILKIENNQKSLFPIAIYDMR